MKYIVLILAIFLIGCAPQVSYQDIYKAYDRVNLDDGVNRHEAIAIAHKEIIKKGLGDRIVTLKPIKAEHLFIWDSPDGRIFLQGPPSSGFQFDVKERWEVLFKERENTYFFGLYTPIPMYVEIDAVSGEVLHIGLKKD